MRRFLTCLAAVTGALSAIHCFAAGALDNGPFLDVIVKNRFFEPAQTGPEFSVRTASAVKLACVLYDRADRPVFYQDLAGPTNRFSFKLEHLPPVSRGVYCFCLVASDVGGTQLGFFPAEPGGGEIITVKESAFEPEQKRLTYVLPKAACVRLRAGLQDGMYLTPIISSLAQPAGPHAVSWDGSCQHGLFTNLYSNPQVHVNILAVSLPVNILVAQEEAGQADNSALPEVTLPTQLASFKAAPWRRPEAKNQPDFLIADDYQLGLEIAADLNKQLAEVQVDCRRSERPRLFSRRFELMLFLDSAFLMEDERSQMPFSYRMSTRGLVPGRHVLTANVIDSEGIVGTTSQEFTLAKP